MVKRWRKEERGVKMPKYRKKPVIIEAVMWDGSQESAQEINQFNGGKFWVINDNRQMKIPTLEGIIIFMAQDTPIFYKWGRNALSSFLFA